MPSNSLDKWNSERAAALDEIENAHAMVGGTERGRRHATQQINYAYATLLSSQFQGFCRDLHSECVDALMSVVPASVRDLCRSAFVLNRSLDKGNPHPGALGSDFSRLGLDFWPQVYALDARNDRRRASLQRLVDWRNAISHQDFAAVAAFGDVTLNLARVRAWRRVLRALANSFDQVAFDHLLQWTGMPPW